MIKIRARGSMLRRSLYARRIMVSPTLNRSQTTKAAADTITVTVNEHKFNMPFMPGQDEPEWANAWRDAVLKEKSKTYIDPATGYSVMTELSHLSRGFCCGNACRHCPYNRINVGKPANERVNAKGELLNKGKGNQIDW